MATAGVIFGIISILAIFGLPGIVTSIVGLFLSVRACNRDTADQRLPIIGIVLNGFFLLAGIVVEAVHIANG